MILSNMANGRGDSDEALGELTLVDPEDVELF